MNFGIIDIVVKEMEKIEKHKNKGEDKKKIVINNIQKIISSEAWGQYADLVPILIEFIVKLSKNEYSVEINKLKKCFSCIS